MIGTKRSLAVRTVSIMAAAMCFLVHAAAAQDPEEENCVTCHRGLGDDRLAPPVAQYVEDVHSAAGFGCVACHGGDVTAAGFDSMDPARGFIGKFERLQISQMCGRCHSDAQFMRRYNPSLRVDQVTEYATSVHGQRLFQMGDSLVATCVDCHPAHSIRPPSDPQSSVHPLQVARTCGACHADAEYMSSYGIPTNQEERYEQSVHWELMSVEHDLSAPTCNDCHGNHGAAPPGIDWVGNTCGQCHTVMADFFAQSTHAQLFPLMGVPGCAACHQNHAILPAGDEMLGLEGDAVCAQCHSAGTTSGDAVIALGESIRTLRTAYEEADSILMEAEVAGMEVSQAHFDLNAANTALVQARAALHSFKLEVVQAEIDNGLEIAGEVHSRGIEALDDLRFRRLGLAVSVTIILVLIAGLVVKIKQIEQTA